MNTLITLSVTHSKPLPAHFVQQVAGRTYTLNGVDNVEVVKTPEIIPLPVVDCMKDEK